MQSHAAPYIPEQRITSGMGAEYGGDHKKFQSSVPGPYNLSDW